VLWCAIPKRKKHTGKVSKPSKDTQRKDGGGRFMGIRIADPPVKPRDTTVREIRRAVDAVFARRKSA
jgi:hypothetical protein